MWESLLEFTLIVKGVNKGERDTGENGEERRGDERGRLMRGRKGDEQ